MLDEGPDRRIDPRAGDATERQASMLLQELKTFVVENPPPHFGGRYWIFVKLATDSGIEGIGEVYSVPFHPHVVERMIEDVFARCVMGTDPFKIERLWR